MYNRGQRLTSGLIDESRLYTVMNKVKTMANASKLINYRQVCEYTHQIDHAQNENLDGVPP